MNRPTRRTVIRLAGVCVFMLGFGYALVPLYDALCDITGFSGTSSNLTRATELSEPTPVAAERHLTVQFSTTTNRSMPWDFRPDQFEMTVTPGQTYHTVFHAHNRTRQAMVGQAVPSVTPLAAALHLVKQECFCFTAQPLEAGESAEMPLVFQVSPDLPPQINTLTLSYTFFDVTQTAHATKAPRI